MIGPACALSHRKLLAMIQICRYGSIQRKSALIYRYMGLAGASDTVQRRKQRPGFDI